MKSKNCLKASKSPIKDIELVTPPGQSSNRRLYKFGYEHYMNAMPRINPNDQNLADKIAATRKLMDQLARNLSDAPWVHNFTPESMGFNRTIIAIESPTFEGQKLIKQGTELVIGHWGEGFETPVHGHAPGYIHEALLFGKLRVNTYQLVGERKVRLLKTEIAVPGYSTSLYSEPKNDSQRQSLIHNFKVIEPSASLHYFTEHTRDGKDNGFEVEYFEDTVGLDKDDFRNITTFEGMYLRKGEVVLVRSSNVPDYGDHFAMATGNYKVNDYGMRPEVIVIEAPHAKSILDLSKSYNGVILLKLKDHLRDEFHEFHNINQTVKL